LNTEVIKTMDLGVITSVKKPDKLNKFKLLGEVFIKN